MGTSVLIVSPILMTAPLEMVALTTSWIYVLGDDALIS